MAYLGSTVPGFPNFFMMQGTSRSTCLDDSNLLIPHPHCRDTFYSIQVQILPLATRPLSFPKSRRSHTFYSCSSPCEPDCSKAWRPPTQRRIGTTTYSKSVSETPSGRSARHGTAPVGAAGSSARSRVRLCCSGGGCGGFVGTITRSRGLARGGGAAATVMRHGGRAGHC